MIEIVQPGKTVQKIERQEHVEMLKAQFDPRYTSLSVAQTNPDDHEKDHLLIVSPYTTLPHLLDTTTLNIQQHLLAKALTHMQPTRPDYATAPYITSFNWATIISNLASLTAQQHSPWPSQSFFIVVFRSQIPTSTDRIHLGELDQRSHAEAIKSGGLLKYWFGVPDGEGRNLATCIWRHQSDVRPASSGPGHKAAAHATKDLYTEWKIERLRLRIEEGVGAWSIEAWES